MTPTGEQAVASPLRTPAWIARIEEPDGRVLGAGALLAPDRVLTAAHVVGPGRRYVVHFPGVPGTAATAGEDECVLTRATIEFVADPGGAHLTPLLGNLDKPSSTQGQTWPPSICHKGTRTGRTGRAGE